MVQHVVFCCLSSEWLERVIRSSVVLSGEKVRSLGGRARRNSLKKSKIIKLQENVPKGSSMTVQTPMYVVVSLHPISSPFPTPPCPASWDPETSTRIPEHFQISLHFEDKSGCYILQWGFFSRSFHFIFGPLNTSFFNFFLKILIFFVRKTVIMGNSKLPYRKRKIITRWISQAKKFTFFISIGVLAILCFSPLRIRGRGEGGGEHAIFDFFLLERFPLAT